MARKTLLTEGELRRFMRLANMRPVGETKLQEMGYSDVPGARDEEEEMEMDMDMGAEDEEVPAEMDMDMAPEDGMVEMHHEDEMGAEPAAEGEMELSDEEAQAIISLADRLQAAMGGEEAGEEDLEMDMDAEEEELDAEEDDLGAPEGGEPEFAADEEEELVAEVSRRVAARLQAQTKKERIVDQLAERIVKRLTK